MAPLLITSRPIRDYLWSRRFRQDEDDLVRQRSQAYVEGKLFFEHISNVFISDVDPMRSCPELETETAILPLDSALLRTSPRILQRLGEKNIIATAFPAHTRNLLQTLDLLFFGALKK
jgi:hypothetical protein